MRSREKRRREEKEKKEEDQLTLVEGLPGCSSPPSRKKESKPAPRSCGQQYYYDFFLFPLFSPPPLRIVQDQRWKERSKWSKGEEEEDETEQENRICVWKGGVYICTDAEILGLSEKKAKFNFIL